MGIGFGFLAIATIVWIAFIVSLFTGSMAFGRRRTEFHRDADPRRFWLFMSALVIGGAVAAGLGCLILAGVIPVPFNSSGI